MESDQHLINLASRIRVTFASLAERDYRLLWLGSLLGATSFLTTFYLAPIVAFEITGSYAASGFAQAGMVAQVVFGPFSGVIADRYRKRPLLLASQIIPAGIVVATGILIVSDNITTPLLFASTFLVGAAFSIMGPARQAWIVELVPRELLPNAVALQSMSLNIATVLGPALFAVFILSMGLSSGVLYMLVAAPFVIAVPLTLMISGSGRAAPPEQRKSIGSEIADGLGYITGRPVLRSLWLFWILIVVTGFGLQTLVPGLLDQEFGRAENEALIIGTIWGVTALPINLILAGVVGSRRWPWPLLFLSACALAGGIWLTAWAPVFAVLLIVSAIAGAARSAAILLNQTMLMSNTRQEYFGRVMSWVFVAIGLQGVLAPVWGAVADAIGGRETLYIVGLVVVIGTLVLALSRSRTRHIPPEPGTAAAAIEAEESSEPQPGGDDEELPPGPRPAS